MTFSFELFVNLISPHATKVTRAADLRVPTNQYCFGCPSQSGGRGGWGFHLRDGQATKTLALRTVPVTICVS